MANRKNEFMKASRRELLYSVLLLLLGGWIWWYSTGFPDLPEGHPGPGLFPRLLGLGLALSGLVLLVMNFLHPEQMDDEAAERSFERMGFWRMLAGLVLVVLYPVIQPLIGFEITLGVICFGMALLLGARVWVAALTASGTVLFVYLIFSTLLGLSI